MMLRTAMGSVLIAVLSVSGSFAAKETLLIQVGKDQDPFDTVAIWIDYAEFPEVPPLVGAWDDGEKDSSWMDGDVRHVRYDHRFLAQLGSQKGVGNDYIHYISDFGDGEPQYTTSCSFHFQFGDTSETWIWDQMHCNDHPDLDGFREGLGDGYLGVMERYVKGRPDAVNLGTWTRLLSREKGWVGGDRNPAALAPVNKASTSNGWLVHLVPGTVLRAPPGAKALRVFDVRGKVHWETRNLVAGAPLSLPEAFPQGPLRYHWL